MLHDERGRVRDVAQGQRAQRASRLHHRQVACNHGIPRLRRLVAQFAFHAGAVPEGQTEQMVGDADHHAAQGNRRGRGGLRRCGVGALPR